jgi:glycosyltransferase involved in cell wall biosynthesis
MERVTLNLIQALDARMTGEVLVMGGDDHDLAATTWPARVLGPRIRGAGRVLGLWRMLRSRGALRHRCVLLVGAWAAVPSLLVLPRSARVVIWEHSLMTENAAASPSLRILRAAARVLYRRADAIVAVSEPLADDLRRLHLGKVVSIPNLVDLPAVLDGVPRRPGQLCMLGTLSPVKNQALGLDALQHLAEDYSLCIVGDGPSRPALERRAVELGVQDRVTFTGFLDRDAALTVVAESEALVHTSRGETFGLVYIEAAALGTPVIATGNRVSEQWERLGLPITTTAPDARAIAEAIRGLRCLGAEPPSDAVPWQSSFTEDAVVTAWLDVLSVASPEAC